MRVQIDRFEDSGWAVLLLYPDGAWSFEAPRELLPEGAAPGACSRHVWSEIWRRRSGSRGMNRRLMDELLEGEG